MSQMPIAATAEDAVRLLKAMPPLREVATHDEATFNNRATLVALVESAVSDPSYVAERMTLIPEAEAFTNTHIGSLRNMGSLWTQTFLAQMDRLWAERGAGK